MPYSRRLSDKGVLLVYSFYTLSVRFRVGEEVCPSFIQWEMGEWEREHGVSDQVRRKCKWKLRIWLIAP